MTTKQIDYDEKIIEAALEEIMQKSYLTFAEYSILSRALPRVEDGLKPVQRRILYTMYDLGILPDKPYKKSARIVGETLGKYHPHGDTSVYDAMVRLAQPYTMRVPLVDGHGNFGSPDGDSAAAMRYTEAKLSPIAVEMLRDLGKDTVHFNPNFDDTELEPEVLPARYPNLLVNGTYGIASGVNTEIPPHNLGEVIDGVILRIEKPDCSLHEMMRKIKAPDFPTGGIIVKSDGLREAYEIGTGRIAVRAKTHFENAPNGKKLIVITEFPYDAKKSKVLEKILEVSESKKSVFGSWISDIRDESDREGIRAVVEVKKGISPDRILNLLFKHTELQKTFSFHMRAIADGAPKMLGLLDMIDYYIKHQKNIITRRTKFDLERAEKREHILFGMIIAVKNIDRVIALIRSSKTPAAAKRRLMSEFNLTAVQAQAILDMRFSRLTNLEVAQLEKEYKETVALIAELKSILSSEEKLKAVLKKELNEIKKKYADKRRTVLIDESDAIIDEEEVVTAAAEECTVVLTRGGGFKRMTQQALRKGAEVELRDEKLRLRKLIPTDTDGKLYIFTDRANMYVLPVISVPEGRMRDAGKTLNTLLSGVSPDETVLNVLTNTDLTEGGLLFATQFGYVKITNALDFDVKKSKIAATGLREEDKLLCVTPVQSDTQSVLLLTSDGISINFARSEIPQMGRTAKGVSAIKLNKDAKVIFAEQVGENDSRSVLQMTNNGFAKRTPLSDFNIQGRNGKGMRSYKLTPEIGSAVAGALPVDQVCTVTAVKKAGETEKFGSEEAPIEGRNAKGKQIVYALLGDQIERVYHNIFE